MHALQPPEAMHASLWRAFQVSIELEPLLIAVGVAVKVTDGAPPRELYRARCRVDRLRAARIERPGKCRVGVDALLTGGQGCQTARPTTQSRWRRILLITIP